MVNRLEIFELHTPEMKLLSAAIMLVDMGNLPGAMSGKVVWPSAGLLLTGERDY